MKTAVARYWTLIALLTIATGIGYMERQLLPLAKHSLSLELGWSEINYATVISAGQAAAAVALLLGGTLVDRVSLKWGAPLVVSASSLAALLAGCAYTLNQHVAARMALGAALALGVPTFLKITSAILPPSQLATGIAFGTAAGAIGAIIAPLLIPQLTAGLGWRISFIVVGSLGCSWALIWVLITRRITLERPKALAPGAPDARARLFNSATLWALAGAKALSDATWWLLLFWLPDLFTRDFGLAEVEVGAPLALIYTLSALGALAAGAVSVRLLARDFALHQVRYGPMLVSALCTAILPAALLATEPMVAALLIGLAVAAHQGFSVNLFALITEVAPADMVGRYSSFCVLCGNLGGMAVTLAAGLVLDAGHGYAPMLIAAPLCYMLALALLRWRVPRIEGIASRALIAA